MDIDFQDIAARIIAGGELSAEEAYALAELPDDCLPGLWGAAEAVTEALMPGTFDTCSIVNARSGRCPEDCHWCAQSAHYRTGADIYPLIPREKCLEAGRRNRRESIGRFSLVTSGRAMRGAELEQACDYVAELAGEGGMGLCASMGLLDADALRKLRRAGVSRYHCNLETAPSYFPSLCSTHTQEDKVGTIEAARAEGMEICSGGIIGMGESRRQRVEFALALRAIRPVSIPLNLLNPIPGTPLESTGMLSDDEIVTAVAIMRLVNPRAVIRFAGGRALLSREVQLRAIRAGVRGAIMGDMLTTSGPAIEADREMVARAGLEWAAYSPEAES